MVSLAEYLTRGIRTVRNNPQIVYTIFLMIAIPLAFLWSAEKFLSASNENQERLEKERIGLLQDVFILLAREKFSDHAFLSDSIHSLKKENDSIESFTVSSIASGTPVVIASLDPEAIGREDNKNAPIYSDLEGIMKRSSVILPFYEGSDRHWRAYRAITSEDGETLGFVFTDISMARIDDLAERNIINAYVFLAAIILAIFLLLIRQARIIDYAVLYRRLEEVDKMKDDFISMAAHELRTPVTIIRGYVDLLRGITGLDDKNKENLSRINISAEQLNTLIGDLLDVARIEQGRISLDAKETDVAELLSSLVESFRPVAEQKKLALALQIEQGLPKIFTDPDRFRQVMTNLIGNAVKYTILGSVTVKAHVEKESLIVRVSDTGIGISAEEQKKLFEKFYRVKGEETKGIQGTGLGLWITREMVRKMKGDITVESIKGKGTDFILTIPLR